jgi:hypothetical protein
MGALNVGGYLSSRSRRESGFLGKSLIFDQGSIRLQSVLRIQE